MELRVPHVTSYAGAPSSLLFLRSARYPQMPCFLKFLRGFWPMPLPLMIHSALALFAQCTRIPTSARSIGFCLIWVCIRSSSSSTGRRSLRIHFQNFHQLQWCPAHGHRSNVPPYRHFQILLDSVINRQTENSMQPIREGRTYQKHGTLSVSY